MRLSLAIVDLGGVTSFPSRSREDSLRLDNVSEIRAPNAESAGFLLDAAIAARTVPGTHWIQFLLVVDVILHTAGKI